jgi:hypothetical protein
MVVVSPTERFPAQIAHLATFYGADQLGNAPNSSNEQRYRAPCIERFQGRQHLLDELP